MSTSWPAWSGRLARAACRCWPAWRTSPARSSSASTPTPTTWASSWLRSRQAGARHRRCCACPRPTTSTPATTRKSAADALRSAQPEAHEVAQAVDAHVLVGADPHDVSGLEQAGRRQLLLALLAELGLHLVVLRRDDGVGEALVAQPLEDRLVELRRTDLTVDQHHHHLQLLAADEVALDHVAPVGPLDRKSTRLNSSH